jgi:hypothetical protein
MYVCVYIYIERERERATTLLGSIKGCSAPRSLKGEAVQMKTLITSNGDLIRERSVANFDLIFSRAN